MFTSFSFDDDMAVGINNVAILLKFNRLTFKFKVATDAALSRSKTICVKIDQEVGDNGSPVLHKNATFKYLGII